MHATLESINVATLYKSTRFHRYEVFHSEHCACFSCEQTFNPREIMEWTDQNMTALCPHCHMDAVVPSYNGTPTDKETLDALNRYAY